MGLDIFITKRKCSEVGYFRKVNFLVKYFTDLGFDVVDQIPFPINKEEVLELLRRCNIVLEDHSQAPILLPTMSGFFFGSTEYDDYYFYDVAKVKSFIEDTLLKELDQLDEDSSIYFETGY